MCVEAFSGSVGQTGSKVTMKVLRAMFVNREALLFDPKLTYLLDIPYEVRDQAAMDFYKAWNSSWALFRSSKKKDKETSPPRFKFRSCRDLNQTIPVLKKCWGCKKGSFSNVFSRSAFWSSENVQEELLADSKLSFHKPTNKWYLHIVKTIESPEENNNRGIASIDPGFRTFATVYDPRGVAVEWSNDTGKLHYLQRKLDELVANRDAKGVTSKRRRRMKNAEGRMRKVLSNMVKEMHRKLCKFLTDEYDTILLPKFETQKMTKRDENGKRQLPSHVSRDANLLSHYRFKQMLKSKCELSGTILIECNESYTSRTCGKCGHLCKPDRSKMKTCEQCGATCDRDVNGARNILIKHLTNSLRLSSSDPARLPCMGGRCSLKAPAISRIFRN